MPLIKSAIKRSRQNGVRKARLQPVRTYMKTMMRKVADATKAGNKDEATKMLPETFKAIDMAAKKRIIHRKNADRKKAKVSKMIAAI